MSRRDVIGADKAARSSNQPSRDDHPPLPPEDAARLSEFARACKAAARAVAMYPPAHPATAATLARIAELMSSAKTSADLRLTILPDSLLLEGRAPARIDRAIGELAALLHSHLVGEITIHPGGDAEAWRRFLLLLARAPDSVRTDGGIARLWTTMGGRHLELREIDYADVLRERTGGLPATWERIITSCLQGDTLSEDTIQALAELASDAVRLPALVAEVEDRAATTVGLPARTAAVLSMVRGIVKAVTTTDPSKIDTVMDNLAAALGQLSPEVMLELLARRVDGNDDDSGTSRLIDDVLRRMSDQVIATFVVRSVARHGTATGLLVQAFQTLVPDEERQRDVLSMAYAEAAASPFAQMGEFESRWANVATTLMLDSYSSSLPERYGAELSGARQKAIEVERITDDPPERIAAWLGSVTPSAVRVLDLLLLKDLLQIEQDPGRWHELMRPVIACLDDLLLVGDFDAADELLAVIVHEAGRAEASARKTAAADALEQLAEGSMTRHIVSHLAALTDAQFERVTSLCKAMSLRLFRPLAEALSMETRAATRNRLTKLLVSYGPTGRQTVERLKISPDPAMRRTAIQLLREFGGREALPDLRVLLNDREPQVQQEAVRAILGIGTDGAYRSLQQALERGTAQTREALLHAIGLVRDERAAPLFVHILRHVDHRGPLRAVYVSAIESLGRLADPESVDPLKEALYRGEWWAPRRTAVLRRTAAAALVRMGTPGALNILREAAGSGSRGVRAVARPALARAEREGRR